jgi:hypothetical protein
MFPASMRRYWTFKRATVIALLAAVISALARTFIKFPPEQIAKWDSGNLLHSPLFLTLYYLFVAIVLWLIYATKHRASWYVWRVWVYCMVLAAALIGLVNLLLPFHAS